MDKRLEIVDKYNFWNGQFPDLELIRNEYIDKLAYYHIGKSFIDIRGYPFGHPLTRLPSSY